MRRVITGGVEVPLVVGCVSHTKMGVRIRRK